MSSLARLLLPDTTTYNSSNPFNSPVSCNYGNKLATVYTYNPYGFLTRIHTGSKISGMIIGDDIFDIGTKGSSGIYYADSTILNYRYGYDTKGLMTLRSERIANRQEIYAYDNLDRLTDITSGSIGQTGTTQTFNYHNNGNIFSKSDMGEYDYLGGKPHAVTQIGSLCAVPK